MNDGRWQWPGWRVALVAGLLTGSGATAEPRFCQESGQNGSPVRPNILLMVLDDLGYADVGVYGCRDFGTPHIDSIARRGCRFTSFHVSSPVCSPCRSGLLSGRYQNRFGHEFNHPEADRARFGLPITERTFAGLLRDAGYRTGHIGKWHLGNPLDEAGSPQARGFDESVWFPGQNKLPPLRFVVNGVSGYSQESYVDTAIASAACDFIGRYRDREWCLYLAFLTPHIPLDLPPGADELFAGIRNRRRRDCAAAMKLVDDEIGRIMERLRETGQEERTLVFVISDNGAYPANGSSNAPWRGTKGTLWEGGIRVPAVAQWPGVIPPETVCEHPVISLDLAATFLAAGGAAIPEGITLDGMDLRPVLDGSAKGDPDRPLFWRYGEQFAVLRGQWKLVWAALPGPPGRFAGGLFDLEHDPGEARDLSGERTDLRGELQGMWDEWNRSNVPPQWSPEVAGAADQRDGG